MNAVLARLGAEARTRWRAWAVLAALAGLVGGAVVAALAGARRTETAYPRFLAATKAFDVLVTNGGTTAENANRVFDFDEIRAHPDVADAALLHIYLPSGTTASGRRVGVDNVVVLADAAGRFGRELNRAHVLDGRLPQAPEELAITFLAGDQLGIGVGDVLRLQLSGPAGGFGSSDVPEQDFRIVGEVAMEGGFPPSSGGLPPLVLLSPSYVAAHPDSLQAFAVRLRAGREGTAAFQQELVRLAPGEQVQATDQIELTSVVQRSVRVQATALRLLAGIVAVVALLLLAQAWARQASLDADDHPVLRSLGMTGAQLRALAVIRSVPLALTAASVSFLTALVLSPLAPIGVARRAELHPGLEVDAGYVGPGAAAVFLAVVSLSALPAWWMARRPISAHRAGAGEGGPSRLAEVLSVARFPAPAVSGARMALEQGRGRLAVPVRSTMTSVVLSVATIAAVISFSASLARLFDDPQQYGWNWDVQVGDPFGPALGAEAQELIDQDAVRAASVGTIARFQIGPVRVDVLATEPVRGRIEPTVVEGRAPRESNEIVLGTRTLRDVGADIGSTVSVAAGDRTADMQVVGRGVFSEFSAASRLGEGAAVTLDGMRRLVPETAPDLVLLRLAPSPEGRALLAQLLETRPANVYVPSKPTDLADLERIGALPSVVAGIVTLMAVATLAHTLVTTVRRRRSDLAVLKVLGFLRSQVSATVAWQSSLIATVAVVVGVPLGIAAGRWAWHLFAQQLGVPPEAVTPVLATVSLAAATIVLANVVAAFPARLAARTRPTAILRAE